MFSKMFRPCLQRASKNVKNLLLLRTTTTTRKAASVHLFEKGLEVDYSGKKRHVTYLWLRENCPNSLSNTNQKMLDITKIDPGIRPISYEVDDIHLYIEWPNDKPSKFPLKWIMENSYDPKKILQSRLLWNADTYSKANVAPAKFDSFMNCEDECKRLVQNFLLYGIAFVQEVPETEEATEKVVERVSKIRETTYGRMWHFTPDLSRADTAYTQEALDRHTDTTYLHEPCGIQVFHCLKHEGTGGRTLLVDGFHAAEKLRKHFPEYFEVLTQVPIKHDYVEDTSEHKNHFRGVGPLLEVYPWNKELCMIRYNNYDRSAIDTVPHDVVQKWYVAHRELTKELRRPENELYTKLTPGTVLFIDNWRVLHGREEFTGHRHLCGCYLTRDDLLNTARGFGLLA